MSETIPYFRPAQPGGGKVGLPIGGKEGRFDVLELTVYFDYISDEAAQERHFEFTLRIPMTKRNTRMSRMFWEFVAQVQMETAGIHVKGEHWDEGVVGYRFTGRTNSYKPRYVCINKLTKWSMPKEGGWGVLRFWKEES